jgi:hypothetical protein
MISKFIDFRIFLISLAFGLLLVYIYQPASTVIYVYPTPDNTNKLNYKDKASNCFRFNPTEIRCPNDPTQINTIPMQG